MRDEGYWSPTDHSSPSADPRAYAWLPIEAEGTTCRLLNDGEFEVFFENGGNGIYTWAQAGQAAEDAKANRKHR